MYIGGCDLDKHLANFQSDAGAYEYRKVVNGEKVGKNSYKLSQALADENWDYISLQQASGKSGKYSTYTALADLIAGIQSRCPQAKLMWHQTWAYASSSTHESFPDYDSNQMTMYNAIVSAARQAVTNHTALNLLIPSALPSRMPVPLSWVTRSIATAIIWRLLMGVIPLPALGLR